jgi:hypothetical protein
MFLILFNTVLFYTAEGLTNLDYSKEKFEV